MLLVMVTTGAENGDGLTELVDLNRIVLESPFDVAPKCQFGDYPDPVEGAVGGNVHGLPAICGGATVTSFLFGIF